MIFSLPSKTRFRGIALAALLPARGLSCLANGDFRIVKSGGALPDALGMIQQYKLNWTAFSLHPKATPVLIKDWDYEPTPFFGVFVKEALNGKIYPVQRMC